MNVAPGQGRCSLIPKEIGDVDCFFVSFHSLHSLHKYCVLCAKNTSGEMVDLDGAVTSSVVLAQGQAPDPSTCLPGISLRSRFPDNSGVGGSGTPHFPVSETVSCLGS